LCPSSSKAIESQQSLEAGASGFRPRQRSSMVAASVWDERRAQLHPGDAAAMNSAARKTDEMFADMRKAGVKVLAGSDLPISGGVPPIHDELVALVRAGMTPSEALEASTRSAAEFLGRLPEEGTVEVGKKAR